MNFTVFTGEDSIPNLMFEQKQPNSEQAKNYLKTFSIGDTCAAYN